LTITGDTHTVQPALDIRSSAAPVIARPVLVARNGDQLPVRPVAAISTFKRIVGQDEPRYRSETRAPEESMRNETPSTVGALVLSPVAAPVSSSLYLAQHIAQEVHGDSPPSKAEGEASVTAYSAAAERGTIFFGLEYPVDFSV
jgi:hypothetical protein